MKKIFVSLMSLALAAVALTGCTGNGSSSSSSSSSSSKTTLKVAALEGGYGTEVWKKVVAAYEKENPNVTVKLTIDKKLEDIISPQMKAGNYPDVVMLATAREAALTETLIREKGLADITDVLDMKVPGESKTVKDKILPGFTDTLATNPYGDGKTYMMPMFYSPTGLFYNKALLKANNWTVPRTWDEMWKLGDEAKAKGISLFTYPTTGYLDTFFYSILQNIGGSKFFANATSYKKGAWASADATTSFEMVGKLAKYTAPTTVANANDNDYKKNQQLILDNKAIFMPNGTWVAGEMKDAPHADGFEWGLTPLPTTKESDQQYAYTFFEQIWMPAAAKEKTAGKKFIAFMYSDKAADIFKAKDAIQPIQGLADTLTGDNKAFYSIYNNGVKPVVGGFDTSKTVEGVDLRETLFGTVNSVVSGDKTVKQWQDSVIKATDALRDAK